MFFAKSQLTHKYKYKQKKSHKISFGIAWSVKTTFEDINNFLETEFRSDTTNNKIKMRMFTEDQGGELRLEFIVGDNDNNAMVYRYRRISIGTKK